MGRKYGPKAQKQVEKEVRAHKSEGKYQSKKQAIAAGLSKARRKGAKAPKKRNS